MDKTTEAELEAGRQASARYEEQARLAREAGAANRENNPALHKPYIADQRINAPDMASPNPTFIRLEDETEEEAEARKAAVLAREEAIMTAREGGAPNPAFDPDAQEAQRVAQEQQTAYEAEQQKLREEADAKVKAQVYATNAQDDDKGITDADREKAEQAKKDEAEAKTGEPSEEAKAADAKAGKKGASKKEDTNVLDDLLKS